MSSKEASPEPQAEEGNPSPLAELLDSRKRARSPAPVPPPSAAVGDEQEEEEEEKEEEARGSGAQRHKVYELEGDSLEELVEAARQAGRHGDYDVADDGTWRKEGLRPRHFGEGVHLGYYVRRLLGVQPPCRAVQLLYGSGGQAEECRLDERRLLCRGAPPARRARRELAACVGVRAPE